jgi:hypothetical protein
MRTSGECLIRFLKVSRALWSGRGPTQFIDYAFIQCIGDLALIEAAAQ